MFESIPAQQVKYVDVFVYPEINDTAIMITTDEDNRYEFNMLEIIDQADIVDYLINL